jgi:glycosyltransferase involved in cell wall biosynthesis
MTARNRHLALLLSNLRGGGAQQRMVTLANAFAARGHRVDLVTVSSEGGFTAEVSPKVNRFGLDPWWVETPPLRNLKGPAVIASAPSLALWLRRTRPDALLSSSNPANLAALAASRLSGTRTPTVISVNVHASSATGHPSRHPALRRMMRRLYPRADGIVAISHGVADDLATLLELPQHRIATIHNPIDQAAIVRRAAEPIDDPWLEDEGPPIVLAVGKLKRQKDVATLLRAFARLLERRSARLVILGEGPERSHLAALAREMGVAHAVRLPGFEPNPAAWMARAAVFALSSEWEGFSNVLVEALTCGCPVVSTDCPSGPAEILEGGAIGPLVPVGDDEALAHALDRVLAWPPDTDKLRECASCFSVDRAADRYLEVLEGAIRARTALPVPEARAARRRARA